MSSASKVYDQLFWVLARPGNLTASQQQLILKLIDIVAQSVAQLSAGVSVLSGIEEPTQEVSDLLAAINAYLASFTVNPNAESNNPAQDCISFVNSVVDSAGVQRGRYRDHP